MDFDAHVHLNWSSKTKEHKFKRLEKNSIEFVVGTCPEDWKEVLRIYRSLKKDIPSGVSAGIGLHPWFVERYSKDELWHNTLKELLEEESTLGVAEIGLDRSSQNRQSFDEQKRVFKTQLHIAACCKRRIASVHCVQAHGPLLELFQSINKTQEVPKAVNLHSWSGSVEITKQLLKLEYLEPKLFFGISASVNFRSLFPFTFSLPGEEDHLWFKEAKVLIDDKFWIHSQSKEKCINPWKQNKQAWNKFASRIKAIPTSKLLLESDMHGYCSQDRRNSLALTLDVLAEALEIHPSKLVMILKTNIMRFLNHSDDKTANTGYFPASPPEDEVMR